MDKKYAQYLLNKTRNDYDLIADDFSRTRHSIWPETKNLLDKYISKKEKILDLGCGNGRYFKYFKEKNIDYFGIDNSEKLIKIAKNKNPEANFQTADAFKLPFPDKFFDKIISIAVLHHIPSKELRIQFIKEAKRVLKTGGILILIVWNFKKIKKFFIYFNSFILKLFGSKLDFGDFLKSWGDKTLRYYHCFSKKELNNLAKKSLLKVKEIGIIKNKKENRQHTYLIIENSLE